MYEAKIQNKSGTVLTLTGNEAVYQVVSIGGLNPPQAQINTTTIVGLDGAVFNSSKLETRNLVITIRINGDVETNRLRLYSLFRTKEWCKFYYKNGSLDVSIEGYVESVECNIFSVSEMAQISILCPFPYFKGLAEILHDSSKSEPLFCFPFSINEDDPVAISNHISAGAVSVYNSSESEAGVQIEIDVHEDCSSIGLQNTVTGDALELTYAFQDGDKIIVNTNKGQKSVTLIRNGVLSNLFSALEQGSVFPQLAVGNNFFEVLVNGVTGGDEVFVLFRYHEIFRGV